jgi:hypothetical protein
MTTAASGLVAVVVTLVAAWILPFGSASRQVSRTEVDLSQDPEVASLLSSLRLPENDIYGKSTTVLGKGSVMLVNGGSCTGCSLHAVSFDRLPFHEFDAIAVFYQADPKEIRKQLQTEGTDRSLHDRLLILPDSKRRIERSLNAIWTGRWYRFERGRLVRWQLGEEDRSWTMDTH